VRARAEITVPGRISEAERLWYDLSRWSSFVDGFHHVREQSPTWPESGTLVWDSLPDGRGRVLEAVERYEPRVGQTVQVEDEKISGHQSVAFEALPEERLRVTLVLEYKLKQNAAGPLMTAVDWLFIRPRQREALARTLNRFARELASDRETADFEP
jgi:hypothetical protein